VESDSPATNTPAGTTKVDDKMSFEPALLSYRSATDVAARLADKLHRCIKGKTVVVADSVFVADIGNLRAVLLVLEELEQDYCSIVETAKNIAGLREVAVQSANEGLESFTPALTPVTAAISAVSAGTTAGLGLLALFRQDVEYTGRQISVNPLAFHLALAGALERREIKKVIVPEMFLAEATNAEGSLRSKIMSIHKQRAKAWELLAKPIAYIAHLESDLDQASRLKKQALVDELADKLREVKSDLDPVTNPLSRVDARFGDVEAFLQRVGETSRLPNVARMLRAESIRSQDPIYLYAAVESSGGSFRTSRNLLRTLFVGDGLSFTGGVIVSWALLDENGAILHAGIMDACRHGRFGRIESNVLTL
jgi:hypothetical protein